MRRAFDADDIGAIGNTTRKLMTDGQRPLSVGFFPSFGDSTVVACWWSDSASAARAPAATCRTTPSLEQATGLFGSTVSGLDLRRDDWLTVELAVRMAKLRRAL